MRRCAELVLADSRFAATRTPPSRPGGQDRDRTNGVSPLSRFFRPAAPAAAPTAAGATLAALAVLLLLLGTLVYLFDRPAGSAWLIPPRWQVGSGAAWFGHVGAWLPSLVHAFAFSILTALVLPWRPGFAASSCGAWALIDTLAECGQHAAVSASLAAGIESAFDGARWAVQVGHYFTRGSFDVADIAAALAGCALAFAALSCTMQRGGRPRPATGPDA